MFRGHARRARDSLNRFISAVQVMLCRSSALFRQVRTLASFTSSLCARICLSEPYKNHGIARRREPCVKIFEQGKGSLQLCYRGLNTTRCRKSTGELGETLKDKSANASSFNSGFSDEEDADISMQPRSKIQGSPVTDYAFNDDGYMNIEDLVGFLKKENALDICVIKTRGISQNYVDYFVVVSGVSTRHIRAMAKNLEQLVGKYEMLMDRVISQTQVIGCFPLG